MSAARSPRGSGRPVRTVRIEGSAADVADAAADLFVRAAADPIAADGRFAVALSGGRTPLPLLERLAADRAREVDWSGVHVFWADERCVPPDHAASNYGAARVHLLDRVALPAPNIHRVAGEMTPPVAAGMYRAQIATFFHAETPEVADTGFDLVLLGLGEDGHIASIFPDSAALAAPEWAIDVHAPPGTPVRWRVTLTAAAIAAASSVVVLATGASKADAVAAALREGGDTPAARLAARREIVWILDRDAAAALDRT